MATLAFKNFDHQSFGLECDYSSKTYEENAPSDEMILKVEEELGYKLPKSYVEFMKEHNGGMVQKSCFLSNNFELILIEGFLSIGEGKIKSLLGEHGSKFWVEEWEYPDIGIYICDTISGGHDMVALDYSKCGKSGEPSVVWIAQENEYEKTILAKNFQVFVEGLRDADLMEEFNELKDEVEDRLFELYSSNNKDKNIEEYIKREEFSRYRVLVFELDLLEVQDRIFKRVEERVEKNIREIAQGFIENFEKVVHSEWKHSREILQEDLFEEDETFIDAKWVSNWHHRDALLSTYSEVKEEVFEFEVLKEKLKEFMFQFEKVFYSDWEYSREMLSSEPNNVEFISDENITWEGQRLLLETYRELESVL